MHGVQVLGGLVVEGGTVQSAQVLGGYYFLAGNETLRQQQEDDVAAMEWEQVFLDILEVRLAFLSLCFFEYLEP